MADYRLTVREWPQSERPREKLAQYGADALSTVELLAIILRTGTAREDVVSLAQRLLVDHGGIAGLADCTMTELAAEHGLGLAKGAQLKAALELVLQRRLCKTAVFSGKSRPMSRLCWPSAPVIAAIRVSRSSTNAALRSYWKNPSL